MALFVAFYAGALTAFKEPLRRWSTPPAAFVQPVPMDEAQPLIARAEPQESDKNRAIALTQ